MKTFTITEIQTTLPNDVRAQRFIQTLIDEKWVRCINQTTVKSTYEWLGVIVNENEILVMMKTSVDKTGNAISRIKEIHPYGLPALLYHQVNTTEEFYKWVNE